MRTNTKRAKAGGEYGANGEWYEGGKFINTVPEQPKRIGSGPKATGKQEIAPYVWEVAPAEGMRSLYNRFSGVFGVVRNGIAELRADDRLPQTLEYFGVTLEQAESMIRQWNAGERWVANS